METADQNLSNGPAPDISGEQASIYGGALPEMQAVLGEFMSRIDAFRRETRAKTGEDPVDHTLSRIKSEESMREKCRRKGLPETAGSALLEIHDAIGVRIVCSFLDDVYRIRSWLESCADYEVVTEKDYIRHAKPNGYRSFHMILRVRGRWFVEVQLRTISMDTWAALEHQLKYKKGSLENDPLIVSELKRCADELASTDISMQTIRDMILGERGRSGEQDHSE